jgi:pimeloyl-ACP methyl ester carboxylesterase
VVGRLRRRPVSTPGSVRWVAPAAGNGEPLELADGRQVGVSQFGAAGGSPVVWCHGGLSSRLDAVLLAGAAARTGVRLIAIDRPGIGQTTLMPDDDVLRWPGIVAAVADRMGIGSFGVAGWSAGGAYALACAYLLPHRVTAAATIAGMYPVSDPARRRELGLATDRRLIRVAMASPKVAGALLQPFRLAPGGMVWRSMRRAVGPAERIELVPDLRDPVVRMMRNAFRQGTAGVVVDYRAFGGDWGFAPRDVAAPVAVWHGTADGLVPFGQGVLLADELPAGTLRTVDGGGHFMFVAHGDEILRRFRAAPKR